VKCIETEGRGLKAQKEQLFSFFLHYIYISQVPFGNKKVLDDIIIKGMYWLNNAKFNSKYGA
jgi:hypothetical protein